MTHKMKEIEQLTISYLTGTATAAERERLLEILNESEANRELFRSRKDTYDLTRMETDVKDSNTRQEWCRFEKALSLSGKTFTAKVISLFMRYAAVFILGIACYGTVGYLLRNTESTNEVLITTGKDELVFDNMPFDELIRKLERMFDVKFVLENEDIKKESFGGTIR
ncbi:MAG: DUF4974 domain-containing protein, partial [Tannerella sp.]|nr:DUF4974 domain-containing protein [Tannerella sp.]